MHTNLQSEAKALGVPTRHQIFRYVADADHPVGVAELTSFLGLNHNAVRQHLAVLVDARLVTEAVEEGGAGGRGRPRLQYQLNPQAAGRWETIGPYEYLAGIFAAALESGQSPREAGRQAGKEVAASLTDEDPLNALEHEMERRGFLPRRIAKGSKIDFVLGRCPFEDLALTNPDAVCQLHLGLAEGLAESVGNLEVVQLVVKNPHRAGCRVEMRQRPTGSTALR